MGWFSKLTKGIGKVFNDITGVSSQQKKQENLANTAHQREAADYEAAGLNRALAAGASAGAETGGTGTPAGDPISAILNTARTMSDIDKQEAETENITQDTKNKTQQHEWNPKIWTAGIQLQNATSAKTKAEKEKILTETVETETRIKLNNIKAEMAGMDKDKRKQFWNEEISIMKEELRHQAIEADFNNSTIGLIINAMGKVIDNASPLVQSHKTTVNYSSNYSPITNSPTVNY